MSLVNKVKNTKMYTLISRLKSYIKFIGNKKLLKLRPINIDILSIEDTIRIITDKSMSVIRFGDGEMMIIENKNLDNYQEHDYELAEQLKEILLLDESKLLLCLPDTFSQLDKYIRKSEIHWTNKIANQKKIYLKYCENRTFGNSFISRPYMIFKNKSESGNWFKMIKGIWNERDIVIIEGNLSRSGVGNDLFDNTNGIERILCPSKNAFTKIEEILSVASTVDHNKLILVALGPSAKILVYRLFKLGYQAIDIGHLDSEYEWYLSGTNERIKIANKHTAEMNDDPSSNDCLDVDYQEQIIARVL